jgi:DNA polymerase III alpha subunit
VQFVTLEDECGLLEATVSPETYQRFADPIKNPGPYLVEGRVEMRHATSVLSVATVRPFHERERPHSTAGSSSEGGGLEERG